ncbi:MAG: hypothetical protein EU532_11295 [Promethearchaeota archaeon]|nr:MAG: hypothetical protein EU532_11295 [Candidatus Lokiarchaeota archaeon]
MQNKEEKKVNPLGRQDPEFKFDIGTAIFIGIGVLISWINMLLILNYQLQNVPSITKIMAYLSIIFTIIIPGVIIGIKNRFWGYGYILGFSIAGIPFLIMVDLFIGGYTFVTALFIFIIMWLIFWKVWRSISKINTSSENKT